MDIQYQKTGRESKPNGRDEELIEWIRKFLWHLESASHYFEGEPLFEEEAAKVIWATVRDASNGSTGSRAPLPDPASFFQRRGSHQ